MNHEVEAYPGELRFLRERLRTLENGICLKGWTCPACKVFNGEELRKLDSCRSCGVTPEQ